MPLPALLIPLLTTLASSGLGLLGQAVLAKGKDVIEEKLGVKLDEAVATPEGLLKLKQLEVDNEQFLLTAAIENRKIDFSFYAEDAKDRASARDMNTRVNESVYASFLAKNITSFLALLVVIGGGSLLAFNSNSDVRTAAVSIVTLVLGFYFGSSSASKSKDDTINKMAGSN